MNGEEEEEDDFFSASAQGSLSDPVVLQEYARLSSKYSDAGYREGITDGKLSTLQQGFDAGFALSVTPSRRLGQIRGHANALLTYLTSLNSMDPRIEQVREIVRDAARARRDDILPVDMEREAHERDEHPDEQFELDQTAQRDMEGLEGELEALGGKDQLGKREQELLDELESRLRQIERELKA
ncbi:hypothetical protein BCR39DRAFT_587954 [Naematelia encephala]|uniref:Protein YAE1 n=1 Tax=Naematelia encephala TaxID=71784 RepID=A0A1Y2B6U6_9TREE|nr:hypothetical protein BCR39DRAFT_587954 [Naematelia encephala]